MLIYFLSLEGGSLTFFGRPLEDLRGSSSLSDVLRNVLEAFLFEVLEMTSADGTEVVRSVHLLYILSCI